MKKTLSMFACMPTGLMRGFPVLFLGFLFPGLSWGVPANPKKVELLQPDGVKITVSLKGDEYYHWNEDENGYTVLKDSHTMNWVYAEQNADGSLNTGKYKVGSYDPGKLGLEKHIRDKGRIKYAKNMRNKRYFSAFQSGAVPPAKTPILTGTMKNLVILARFSDQTTTYSQAQLSSLFNDTGYVTDGAVGSVKDFYHEISYNKLTMESTVSQWVTLPNTIAYYGANGDANAQQMISDAINALDTAGFDFSTMDGNGDGWVDGLDIIHSGRGEEYGGNNPDYIWSHMWDLTAPVTKDGVQMQLYHTEPEVRGWDTDLSSSITRIGVICHETGHFLGLPDLYDYGYDSQGAGDLCLMAGGSWNGDSGSSPAHMSAWCKKTLGWAAPTQLVMSGNYSLARVEDDANAMYLLRGAGFAATEYFLMENKQGYGFDASLPGAIRGILIWHVDETQTDNNDQTHYLVDLEEAGGIQNLENNTSAGNDADYYRLGNNTVFDDTTTPNSLSYSGKPLGMTVQDITASGNSMRFYLRGVDPALPPMTVYPQPWKPGSGGSHDAAGIIFANLPDEATVRIYTIAGELVREFAVVRADLNVKVWDGKNTAGKNAASGVYFANVKISSSNMKILKIAIER
ncbi:MAG: hypothetical protein A2270_11465 [Elusimicrobia bacterium RIFOXYA12_FULL_51_18]|nr:MAG: hypothetical protein A2270_11465 [Elusimicrobia bacterium RIFOXYA12_FULL_51_18]OGS30364.1 MAG: hypothetical protein A2218_01750 [Elusimicrobia bacterium RIFOXYA2_FULL_53_38]